MKLILLHKTWICEYLEIWLDYLFILVYNNSDRLLGSRLCVLYVWHISVCMVNLLTCSLSVYLTASLIGST